MITRIKYFLNFVNLFHHAYFYAIFCTLHLNFHLQKFTNCGSKNLPQFSEDRSTCNVRQNICRLFHFLAQFSFSTSETELDYYHQKVNVRVAI